MRNHRLRPVQHPAGAVALRGRHHIRQVIAGLPLAVCECQLQAALGDRRQQGRLLRRRPGHVQSGPGQHDGGEIRLQHQHAAERLHHQHDFLGAAAEAAILLGERQPEQALFGELRPDGGGIALGQAHIALALSETVRVAQHARHALDQQPLVVGWFEVHYSPNTALVRIFFWISFVPP